MENEAQLAMVLGHEIAHVTEKHVTKGIEQAYTTQLIGNSAVVAGASTGILPTGDALRVAYDASMNAAVNGHGRGQEREADKVGMDYMVKAGYDPREGPITFELLLKEHGDQSRLVNFFYGSHPNNVDRYETLSALVKDKYGREVKDKRLVVNTEEFKRVTRSVVIATGRLDYEQQRFNTAQAMFEKAIRSWQDDPVPHYYLGKIALETGAADGVDRALAHLADAIKADAAYRAGAPRAGPGLLPQGRSSERDRQPRALPRAGPEGCGHEADRGHHRGAEAVLPLTAEPCDEPLHTTRSHVACVWRRCCSRHRTPALSGFGARRIRRRLPSASRSPRQGPGSRRSRPPSSWSMTTRARASRSCRSAR